jgi:minor extracellular serine protease Vpr
VTAGDKTAFVSSSTFLNPLTGQVAITEVIPAGAGSLTVTSKSGRACSADAYLLDTAAQFTGKNAVIERMIESPGCSANAITVGSYNWNNIFDLRGTLLSLRDSAAPANRAMTIGELSAYSCPGFWRFGNAVKPEITAPGQWWATTAPLSLPAVDQDRDSSGKYRGFNGTSAATPYAAGVVALMLQKNPKLTLGQIRGLLKTCATSDEFTGTVPNVHWGYGKLDLAAANRLIKQAGGK